jgi:hypothetical protein
MLVITSNLLFAQPVTNCPNTEQALKERWKWAIHEAEAHQGGQAYWIGYSFMKPMGQNSFIGSFYSEMRKNKPSLCEVLGLGPCVREEWTRESTHNMTMNDNFTIVDDGTGNNGEILKEIAILFEVPKNPTTQDPFSTITVSNMSLHVNLNGQPLIWLGGVDDSESVTFLQSMYDQRQSEKIQKKIVIAIGLHKSSEAVVSFLSNMLSKAERAEVRKEAAFWVGQTKSDKALEILTHSVESDHSEEVREQAVFAISELDDDGGTDALISLAQKNHDKEIRSKAMFWLGQKASKKSVETLEDIATDNDDTDLQKSAVFALTQLPDNGGVESLIKIAKTHSNSRIRKEAIFWLGQTDDERALSALIDIVRK